MIKHKTDTTKELWEHSTEFLCFGGKGKGGDEGMFKDGSPEAVIPSLSLCRFISFLLICVYLFLKMD